MDGTRAALYIVDFKAVVVVRPILVAWSEVDLAEHLGEAQGGYFVRGCS